MPDFGDFLQGAFCLVMRPPNSKISVTHEIEMKSLKRSSSNNNNNNNSNAVVIIVVIVSSRVTRQKWLSTYQLLRNWPLSIHHRSTKNNNTSEPYNCILEDEASIPPGYSSRWKLELGSLYGCYLTTASTNNNNPLTTYLTSTGDWRSSPDTWSVKSSSSLLKFWTPNANTGRFGISCKDILSVILLYMPSWRCYVHHQSHI